MLHSYVCRYRMLTLHDSVHSLLPRRVLKAARTSLRALKTSSVPGRQSAFSSLSLMGLRSLL